VKQIVPFLKNIDLIGEDISACTLVPMVGIYTGTVLARTVVHILLLENLETINITAISLVPMINISTIIELAKQLASFLYGLILMETIVFVNGLVEIII